VNKLIFEHAGFNTLLIAGNRPLALHDLRASWRWIADKIDQRLFELESLKVPMVHEALAIRGSMELLVTFLRSQQIIKPAARVKLRERNEGPIVLDNVKRKLTKPQYNVVRTALAAPEGGWTKDALVEKSGHEDALGILRRLADSDRDWEQVIHFAGVTGGGYWIK
jgi:hypothetical protein